MSKWVSVAIAALLGMMAMGLVLMLGSETLAVVVGVLLVVMGAIPIGVLLLEAVASGREHLGKGCPPVVTVAPSESERDVLPAVTFQRRALEAPHRLRLTDGREAGR